MKKLLPTLIVIISFVACNSTKTPEQSPIDTTYCNKDFGIDSIGFMAQGGILDKYDNGRVYYSIVRIVDPKDWDYNEYFTGKGFSTKESDAMKVLEKDSCQLKDKYFRLYSK